MKNIKHLQLSLSHAISLSQGTELHPAVVWEAKEGCEQSMKGWIDSTLQLWEGRKSQTSRTSQINEGTPILNKSKKLMEIAECLKSYKSLFFSLKGSTVSTQSNEEMN